MVRLQKQVATTFYNISVELVRLETLIHVHPLIREMFPRELKQNVPREERISYFFQSFEKLSKDQEILEIVKGYKIPLLRTQVQEKIPLNPPLKKSEISSGKRDQRNVGEGSNKESLATQRDVGYRPVTILKSLNRFVP